MKGQIVLTFVLLIFFATAVRGLNITQCQGALNESYTCPGLSDPPERTQCCLWNIHPVCCVPGGSSCSDSADKRNYCPGPDNGNELTQCCVWDGQPTCCLPGGSSCSDSADKRNYCPGPDNGSEVTQCCVWDSQPSCCHPGGSSCNDHTNIRNYCPPPHDRNKEYPICCENDDEKPTCCMRKRFSGIVEFLLAWLSLIGIGCFGMATVSVVLYLIDKCRGRNGDPI